MLLICAGVFLAGCNDKESIGKVTSGGNVSPQKQNQDDYSEYIRSALESVSKDSKKEPEVEADNKEQNIMVAPSENAKPQREVSSSEYFDDTESDFDDELNQDAGETDENEAISNAEGTDAEEKKDLTPDDFPVGTSSIYIKGEVDSGFGADLIKCLNKARAELGFEELTEKSGLDKCADRRTREITTGLSHTRPNGLPYYSLAPDYFKAEMLAVDVATAEETVDAWIKDPASRALVFNTKYKSVGATGFKCNGWYYSVIAFGY